MRPFFYLSRIVLLVAVLFLAMQNSGLLTPARADVWGKLYVETDPPGAQVRFLGIKYEYMPGIILRDGTYSIEVSSPGYDNITREVRVVGGQSSTVSVVLLPQEGGPEAQQPAAPADTAPDDTPQEPTSQTWGKLYIDTDPPGASIRFMTINYKYKPGIILRKGTYLVEVSMPGAGTVQKELSLEPGIDNRYLIRLADPVSSAEALQIPTTGFTQPPGRLIVITAPPGVPVRFVDSDMRYTPGMPLQPGHYVLEVSDTAGRKVVKEVDITAGRETRIMASLGPREQSQTGSQALPKSLRKYAIPSTQKQQADSGQELAPPPAEPKPVPPVPPVLQDGQLVIYTTPPDARIRLGNTGSPYQPGMVLPVGTYAVEVSKDGYETFSRDVDVVGGKTQRLAVKLRQQNTMPGLPTSLKKYAIPAPLKKEAQKPGTPPPAAEGSLMLRIDPPGSSVYFLNTHRPYSPGVRLPVGSYQIKIDKPGYESVTIHVEIKAGKELEAEIRLRPETQAADAPPAAYAPAPGQSSAYPQLKADLSPEAEAPAVSLTPEQQALREANQLMNTGMYKEAFQLFGQVLKSDPKMAGAFKGRGFIYYKLGKYKHAVKEYDKCIALAPGDAQAFYERGNAYLAARSKKRALQDYNRALTLNPKFADAYNARGTVHYASQQYLNALEDYTRALNIDATYADAYFNRAATHMKLGMYELAVKDYDAVLRLDPSDPTARKKRNQAYKKLGK